MYKNLFAHAIAFLSIALFSCSNSSSPAEESTEAAVSEVPVVTYNVIYDSNGATSGIVPTDPTEYEEGETATILGNTGNLSKTGYYFAGWNDQADGTGGTYAGGNILTIGIADVVLYAKWGTFSVVYYANGGNTNVPVDPTNYTTGQLLTVL